MRYLILLSVVPFLFSCNSNCSCKMAEANVTAVQALYDSFAEGDVDAVLAGLSADIEWNEAENFIYADGNPYKGPEAVAEGVFARIGGEWEYWNLEDKSFSSLGTSGVLVTGRYKGKHKASGNELDAQFAHVWNVVEGKPASFQQYTDTKAAAEAVVVPEPAAEEATEE